VEARGSITAAAHKAAERCTCGGKEMHSTSQNPVDEEKHQAKPPPRSFLGSCFSHPKSARHQRQGQAIFGHNSVLSRPFQQAITLDHTLYAGQGFCGFFP